MPESCSENTASVFARPFVKWAGGKRQLLDLLLANIPETYSRFFEPFVGGGALLLRLAPERACISDINPELVNTYKVIRQQPDELLASLKKHQNNEAYFYAVRALAPSSLNEVERASRFIFLNKTCFNGLYRENSKGQFNVPFGRYKKPNIADEANLRAISEYLNRSSVTIACQDFRAAAAMAKKGDFLYFDPPYHPTSKTASFTKYAGGDFSAADQEELAETFARLSKRGCKVMLSNSNVPFVWKLYSDFRIIEVEAARCINCNAEKRGKGMYEVLVKNY